MALFFIFYEDDDFDEEVVDRDENEIEDLIRDFVDEFLICYD